MLFGLTSTTSSHKTQIIKFGHLIFHGCPFIPQFGTVVLIITRPNEDICTISHIHKSHNFKGNR